MRLLHYYGRFADGTFAFEVRSIVPDNDPATVASLQAVSAVGITVVDAATNARPANAPQPADPLKGKYASAVLTNEKVDVIAEKLGLK